MTADQSDRAPADGPCSFVTFYSFKGGVGRSMAVINVAGILAARGFRVLVIDMDLEAPGLSYLANEMVQDDPGRAQPGLVDLLLDAVERDAEADIFTLSPQHAIERYSAVYSLPPEFLRQPGGSLRIMPAGRLDAEYPARLNRLDLPSLYRAGSGLALVQVFKQVIQQSQLFDHVFVDSRTGFSDESGICTRDLADYVVVVSGLNKQNVEGTTRFLSAFRSATTVDTPITMILSPVPNGEDALVDERVRTARTAFETAWGGRIQMDLSLPYHPQLALTEEPHIFRRRRGYLFDAYCQIERHLLSILDQTIESLEKKFAAALRERNFTTALTRLRRASMVADTNEWLNGFIFTLTATEPLPDVEQAAAIYEFLIKNGHPRFVQYLALKIGDHATKLWNEQRKIEAAGAVFKVALVADPNNVHILGNYATFLYKELKELDGAEALYRRALDADPKDARHLGNYANFLYRGRKDLDGAETLYRRALDADPKSASNLGNYAHFLYEGRKDLDGAEALYRRALDADPKQASNLGNYGNFLHQERNDLDGAEALYRRALDVDPKQANILGNYASFLHQERNDLDGAEALYRRALDADPKQATILGNYANFLHQERKDLDAAEALYRRALDVDPKHANILGNYANFLHQEHNDLDGAEALYRRALDADPKHANHIGNYGNFLRAERKDLDAAEALYRRALDVDPKHANNLGNYANFLDQERKDPEAAEAFYRRAFDADPKDANCLGNAARIYLTTDRVPEGMELVHRALDILEQKEPSAIDVECWMYAYCCGPPERRPLALKHLRELVETRSIHTGDWDFSGVIRTAQGMHHPEAERLPPLAEVLAGRQSAAVVLVAWEAWHAAT